jgi:uncharacterized membrane protein
MSTKTFGRIKNITCVVMSAIFAVSIWFGNWIVPIAAIFAAMVFFAVLMFRVKDVIADERTNNVANKSAYFTMTIGNIVMAITGTVLVAINRDDLSAAQAQIGFTLLFTTCALMVINTMAYTYNNRKLGGKSE